MIIIWNHRVNILNMITMKKILYKYIVIIIMSYQMYNRIYLKIESRERSK